MKKLFAICAMLCAGLAAAGDKPTAAQNSDALKGEVLEVKEVDAYSYLRLKTRDGEIWAAVLKAPVNKGAQVTVENPMTMTNFESRALKKTFPKIVFGTLAGTDTAKAAPAGASGGNPHAGMSKAVESAPIKVEKATGPNARTVAEINGKATSLKDKPVVVRGKVVKYSPEIMGKNWVHLQDGSGAAKDNSNDLLVTTKDQAKLGDIVVVKGTVRTNKDFGSGYSYKVLVEDASLQK